MFCSKCGTELIEGVEFCSKCGAKVGVSAEGQNTMNQQNENRPVTTQVVVMPTGTGPLVMGLLGLFGGFIPIVKYITGLLSLLAIFVGASQRKKLKGAGLPTGKATAGIVLGSIAVLITVITIAFSAMIIGSLLSGGSSSKSLSSGGGSSDSRKRINYFTNTLPRGIQGTEWTNGSFNLEFDKNKVKLKDDWYPVKKIEEGIRSNSMVTWIYFGDYYVALQYGKLDRLYFSSGTSVSQGGFKTPAEFEAERIENERIAKEIAGVWEGSFVSTRGNEIGMKLNVYWSEGNYTAIFDFFALPGRSNMWYQQNGSARMSVSYLNGEYQYNYRLKFLGWIVNSGYDPMDLQGKVEDNVLSGRITQSNSNYNFRAVRKN
jgi:hypothetical protein